MRRPARAAALALVTCVACVACVACGEPAVGLEVPPRAEGQTTLDLGGILDDAITERLREPVGGLDVVALTWETPDASLGTADRAGKAVLAAWDADVVLVAVAQPGDFTSHDADRDRFFGVVPADRLAVPGGLRERIVEELVPTHSRVNDWPAAFTAALNAMVAQIGPS